MAVVIPSDASHFRHRGELGYLHALDGKVFVDSGAFNNDTECVNRVRGNAADHLTKDVAP